MKKMGVKNRVEIGVSNKNKLLYVVGTAFAVGVLAIIAFFYLNTSVNHSAKALVNNSYTHAVGNEGFTSFADGTSLGSTSTDEEVFSNLDLGFTFLYDGINYDKVSVAANGFIAMGSSITSSSTPISSGSTNNIISAVGGNIKAKSGASLRYKTIGATPNRVFIVQWTNYIISNNSDDLDFQIHLFENSNKIKFVYGPLKKNSGTTDVQVGLRGASSTDYYNLRTSWLIPVKGTTNTDKLTISTLALTTGLTYTFTPTINPTNADLTLNISSSETNACIGTPIVQTINIANNGPDDATNILVTSAIPMGLTYSSFNVSHGTFDYTNGKWTIGYLKNGETATLEISSKTNKSGNITTTASRTSANQNDNNLVNNTSSIVINGINNNLPTISLIANQTASFNTSTSAIPFTINDTETPNGLTVTASSSNTTCIPLANVVLGGSGKNRTIKLTPGNNQSGRSIIAVVVSDGTCSATESFEIFVSRQTYTIFQEANIVVGQSDFAMQKLSPSQIDAYGSNCTAVSSKGVLAVGSQLAQRALLWNKVPTTNGTPADLVVGKMKFEISGDSVGQNRTSNVDGVAFTPDGNKLIVCDAGNNRVLIFNSIPTTNGQKADVVLGQTTWTAKTGGIGPRKFNRPTDAMVTPDGKLIINDCNNHRVLIYNKVPSSGTVDPDVVIGQPNFNSNTGGTSDSTLRTPFSCSLSPDGKLLIAEYENNRVLIFDEVPTKNQAHATNVIGQSNFTSSTGGCTNLKLAYPVGVTVSPKGMLAIGDYSNNRVLIYNSVPATMNVPADIVLGQRNFTESFAFSNGSGGSGTPDNKNMKSPYRINFDLNERLFVNGRDMHRVMIFGVTPTEVSDLALSFSSNNITPCMGSLVSYTINVTNNGPKEATNVVVTSALPYGFTPISYTSSSGTYSSNSGFWDIPSIPNGTTVSLTFTGKVNAGQGNSMITAYANVRSNNQTDNNYSNNATSMDIKVADNTVPVISTIADRIIDVNSNTGAIDFTVNDAQTVNVTATSSNTAIVPNTPTNINVTGTGVNRKITITPALNQMGAVTITINATDGSCGSTQTFKVNVGNIWLGYTTDWDTKSNWTSAVPTSALSISIPSAPIGGKFPIVNSAAEAKNVTLEEGATLTVSPTRTLSIYGDYTNNGNAFTGTGDIEFVSSSAQNIAGKISNLIIKNSNGLTLAGDVNASGLITLTNGNLTVGSKALTLQKPNAGTSSLVAGSTSTLIIDGTGSGITIPTNVTALKTLTINNPNGATMAGDLQVTNLSLTNGALAINNRTLTIAGSVTTINGTISGSNTSNLIINGNGDISGIKFTPGSQVLKDFTLNRFGKTTLASDLSISNSLDLTKGKIKTGSYRLTVLNVSPTSITNQNASSYVEGNLRRYVNSSGTYNLPVGCASYYQPAIININSSSGITYIDSKYTVGVTGTWQDILMGQTAIQDILDYGFWTVSPNDENNYTVDYDLTVFAKGSNNLAPSSDQMTLVKRHNSTDKWAIYGIHNNAWNSIKDGVATVVRKSMTSFSDISAGMSNAPLPIEMGEFTGAYENKTVNLKWTTLQEVNNDRFEVERSTDGIDFSKIGEVKGSGNTKIKTSYSFVDRNVYDEKLYYRLKQVDFNGDQSYSNIVVVQTKQAINAFALEIYPNPTTSDNINISLSSPDKGSKINVIILDIQGRVLHKEVINGIKTGNYFKLNPSSRLAAKTYYIKVQQGSVTAIKDLIIKE